MAHPRAAVACAIVLGVLAPSVAGAFDGWRVERTEHFEFIYEERDRFVVDELLTFAEEVYELLDRYLPYDPPHVPVVVRGRTDQANGYFALSPRHISINVASPTDQSMGARTSSWVRAVFVHELAHYLHLTEPIGIFGTLGRVFGDDVLAWNVLLLSGWMIEGITTNVETIFTGGGRGRDPFFELYYKALILEDEMFTFTQAGYSSTVPPQGRIYVAGYIMVDYLLRTYGDDAFHDVYREFTRWPIFPRGVRGAIRRITGSSPRQFFDEMIADLRRDFDATITVPRGTPWSGDGDRYLPVLTDTGLYGYRDTVRQGPAVVRVDSDGREEAVVFAGRLTDAFSFSVDSSGRYLAATALEYDTNHPSGPVDASIPWFVDLETGDRRRIPGVSGVHHPAVAPGGGAVYAVQRVGSHSRLVRIDPRSGEIVPLVDGDDFRVYTPAVAPDGRRIAFAANVAGAQDLAVFDSGETTRLRLDGAQYHPRWDGPDHLLFSSDHEGSLSVYRVHVGTGAVKPAVHDRIGATAAIRSASGGYLYQSYSPRGWVVLAGDALEAGTHGDSDAGGAATRLTAVVDRSLGTAGNSGAADSASAAGSSDSGTGRRYRPRSLVHSWAPYLWEPLLWPRELGGVPLGVGFTAYGANYLGTRSAIIDLGYIPALTQPFAGIQLSQDLGRVSLYQDLLYQPGYSFAANGFTTSIASTLGVTPTLYQAVSPTRWTEAVVSAAVTGELTRVSDQIRGFGQPSPGSSLLGTVSVSAGAELGAWQRGLPPLAFYGGNNAVVGVSAWMWPILRGEPNAQLVAVASLSGAVRTVRAQRLGAEAALAWGYDIAPFGVLSYRGNSGWEPDSVFDATWRGRLTLEYDIPIALFDVPFLGLGLTRVGATVFAQTAASVYEDRVIRPDRFAVVGAEIEAPVTAGNLTLPLSVGVAARLPYDGSFDPVTDLTLLFSFLLVDVIVQRDADGGCLTPSRAGCTFQTSSWTSQSSSRSRSTIR